MKKNAIIILLCQFAIHFCSGAAEAPISQSPRIDSLYFLLKLHNEQDSEQLSILLSLAEAQELSNPNKGIDAANKAIKLAEILNREQEVAVAYNQKARLLIMQQLADKANEALKKSINLNRKLNNKDQLAENDLTVAQFIFCQRKSDTTLNYIDKSYEHFKNSGSNFVLGKLFLFSGAQKGFINTDTARILYLEAKECFEKCGRNDWLAFANFYLATNYTSLNENDYAMKYFKITENLNRSLHSGLIAENLYCTIGYLYFSLGEFPKAMSNFIPGLKIAESINDEMMQACLLGNLGGVMCSMKNFISSRDYTEKQIAIAQRINDGYTLSSGHQNLGWIEYEKGNYIDALKYFKMALQIALGIKQFDSMSECYGAVGSACEKLGNFNEAYANLNDALKLNRQQGNYYNICENLLALSRLILKSGNSNIHDELGRNLGEKVKQEKAVEYALAALNISELKNTLTMKRDALRQLSDLYDLTGDEKKTYNYYKKYIAVKDSIMSSENLNSILTLQIQFDTDKREQQIALLTRQASLQQTELRKQSTTRNVFIVALGLTALLAGIIYNRYRIKQKANSAIKTTMLHLKNTQKQLVEHERLASLGKFTAAVAREIEIPVSRINQLNLLNIKLLQKISKAMAIPDTELLKNNLENIFKHGNEADAIVKKVLSETRKLNG